MAEKTIAVGAHTNAVDAARAAGVSMSDDGKLRYGKAGGNGNDAFNYRKGSGASALSFVFAMNAAYNGNALASRAALALDQTAYVEANVWPGNTRGGIEPALASMAGRGYIENVNGGWRLTQRGLTCARLMLSDCGIAWPDDETPAESKPKAKKAKKARTKKPVIGPGQAIAIGEDGHAEVTKVELDEAPAPNNDDANGPAQF